MPVDAELSHLGFEGLSGETKPCRSTGRAADDTVRLAQRDLDDRLLTLSQIYGQCAAWHSGLGRSWCQPAGIHPKDIPVAQDHCPLDHILELTNVTGPVIGFEQIQRVLADTSHPLAGLLSISFDQIFHEQWNVTTPIPKRRDLNRKDIEPVEQVCAEATVPDGCREVLVRRREHADVDEYRLVSTDAFEFSLLKDPEQGDLRFRRQLSDLVQKDRPAVC